MSRQSEVERFIRELRTLGVTVRTTHNGHFLLSVDGRHVCGLASTPGDHRWRANTIAKLRRAGVRDVS